MLMKRSTIISSLVLFYLSFTSLGATVGWGYGMFTNSPYSPAKTGEVDPIKPGWYTLGAYYSLKAQTSVETLHSDNVFREHTPETPLTGLVLEILDDEWAFVALGGYTRSMTLAQAETRLGLSTAARVHRKTLEALICSKYVLKEADVTEVKVALLTATRDLFRRHQYLGLTPGNGLNGLGGYDIPWW